MIPILWQKEKAGHPLWRLIILSVMIRDMQGLSTKRSRILIMDRLMTGLSQLLNQGAGSPMIN